MFLILRRLSHKQGALQWEVWGPNGASLQHLRGASHCVQTTLLKALKASVGQSLYGTWQKKGLEQLHKQHLDLPLQLAQASWLPGHPHQQGVDGGEPPGSPHKTEDGKALLHSGSSDGLGKASHTSWWSLPWMAQEEHISGERWELNWGKMKLPVTGGGGLFGTKYLWKVTASLSGPLMVIPMYHPPFAKHLFTDHKVHEKTAPQPACDFTLMA